MEIKNYQDLAEAMGESKATEERLSRRVYKSTNCGAWLRFIPKGIVVGSIVEGVDYGTETYELKFPFTDKKFWNTLDDVEQEAKDIWNDTHGCERCESDGFISEFGTPMINPDCPECHGEGMII